MGDQLYPLDALREPQITHQLPRINLFCKYPQLRMRLAAARVDHQRALEALTGDVGKKR